MIFLQIVAVGVTFGLLFGCTSRTVSPKELARWVRDPENGLVDQVQAGPLIFSMQYIPQRLLVAIAHTRPGNQAHGSGLSVFELSISHSDSLSGDPLFVGVTDYDAFTLRMQAIAFKIAEDIALLVGDKTIACTSAMFQQDVGLGKRRLIRLVFPISEDELLHYDALLIRWSDRVYETGLHLFETSMSSMKHLPNV